ncbi:hypothetical protein ES702_05223 [subsurface metagenome]
MKKTTATYLLVFVTYMFLGSQESSASVFCKFQAQTKRLAALVFTKKLPPNSRETNEILLKEEYPQLILYKETILQSYEQFANSRSQVREKFLPEDGFHHFAHLTNIVVNRLQEKQRGNEVAERIQEICEYSFLEMRAIVDIRYLGGSTAGEWAELVRNRYPDFK